MFIHRKAANAKKAPAAETTQIAGEITPRKNAAAYVDGRINALRMSQDGMAFGRIIVANSTTKPAANPEITVKKKISMKLY